MPASSAVRVRPAGRIHGRLRVPGDKSIALQPFAPQQKDPSDQSRVNEFALVQEVIAELRNIRAEMKLDPKKGKTVVEITKAKLSSGYLASTSTLPRANSTPETSSKFLRHASRTPGATSSATTGE